MSLLAHFGSRKRVADPDDSRVSAYEVKRSRNIAENKLALLALGLGEFNPSMSSSLAAARAQKASNAVAKKATGAAAKAGPKRKLNPLSIWSKPAPAAPSRVDAHPGTRFSDHFMCMSDAACAVCARDDDEAGNDMLLCDGCDAGYHLRCLDPPLSRVPRKEWLCPECAPAPGSCSGSPLRSSSPARSSKAPACSSIRRRSPAPASPRGTTSGLSAALVATSPPAASRAAAREAAQERRAECESVLRQLRQELMLSAVPERLLCRETQMNAIMAFAHRCFAGAKGGAMYVAGSPGLGKSMTVREAYRQLAARAAPAAAASASASSSRQPRRQAAPSTTLATAGRTGSTALADSGPAGAASSDCATEPLPGPQRSCFLNAFQLQTPAAVYAALLKELCVDQAAIDVATSPRQALERFLVPASADADTAGAPVSAGSTVLARSGPLASVGRRTSRALAQPMLVEKQKQKAPKAAAARGGARGRKTAIVLSSTEKDEAGHSATATGGGGMCFVVIDELDQLLGRDHEALHALFEWAAAPSSRLVLLGIANSLDMIQRFLPRLRARNAVPASLTFPPYAAEELASILKQRVEQAVAVYRNTPAPSDSPAPIGRKRRRAGATDIKSPLRKGEPLVPVVDSPLSVPGSASSAPSTSTSSTGQNLAARPASISAASFASTSVAASKPAATISTALVAVSSSSSSSVPAAPMQRTQSTLPVVELVAIVFCARKVAAASGDARRALQVCYVQFPIYIYMCVCVYIYTDIYTHTHTCIYDKARTIR